MLNHWKVISIVEVAIFSIYIISTVYPSFRIIKSQSKFRRFYLRFFILTFCKLISGALLIPYISQVNNALSGDGSANVNLNLLIASISLNSVSVGLIIMMNLFISNYAATLSSSNPDIDSEDGGHSKSFVIRFAYWFLPIQAIHQCRRGQYSFAYESGVQKITIYAILINVIGASISNGTSAGGQEAAKGLVRAGSLLYLICAIYNAYFAIVKLQKSKNAYLRKILWCALCVIPFLVVRIIYYVLYAFHFEVNSDGGFNVNRFSFLFGDWSIYLGMAFVEECVCILIFVCVSWIVCKSEQKTFNGDSSFKAEEF